LNNSVLARIAETIGRKREASGFRKESDALSVFVHEKMWDRKTGFYYDRFPGGRLSRVKTIGAFWALFAGIPENRLARFIKHLENPAEFNRSHRIPTLSADHPQYDAKGGYWLGAVWAPTDYMVLRGLDSVGKPDLAFDIAGNHHDNVIKVFEKTGTFWENYSPEYAMPGKPAADDFVGWTGLVPITVLLEYIFGLKPDPHAGKLRWEVRLTEEHGVKRYPFGLRGVMDLRCARRKKPADRPEISVYSNVPVDIEVRWQAGKDILRIRR